MAEVPSTCILPLDSDAPGFTLPDAEGEVLTLEDARGPKGLVVAFLCNHCPFVLHLARAIGEFAANCEARGVGFVGINSNDVSRYPADSPENMREMERRYGWTFPYLYDETQSVARDYRAACTPDFYVFNADLRLAYCGQSDDSRPSNGKPVNGDSLRAAVQSLLEGTPLTAPQRPSSGCNIKWKKGGEPAWYAG